MAKSEKVIESSLYTLGERSNLIIVRLETLGLLQSSVEGFEIIKKHFMTLPLYMVCLSVYSMG